ncbi:MAG TPA: bifunctional diaminohydroxyphosphoribosylaminopyrimidine deaminase/5-amino-6-(5-phosphoribosylamino)uracil reductase RibD, partial [Myxococcales bacterium]|nr:bifunctional diaminohydroxyphosphoribosylaminopyrimidine deaminase/5-amino-6-(5-phosphoribosylamino)uracil reductase RibD [Myxococcales bacterium]
MRLALAEAEKGRGRTHPNPAVGALVVRKGRVIARGHHERAGLPHAEVNALRGAGERARGADVYVSLEPCNHQGRTPPCTEALIAAGVRRVFFGSRDPNPRVHGHGARRLRRAGIEVRPGVLQTECDASNEPWFKFITTGIPWVVLKAAVTLDGKLAPRR